MRCLVTGAAGFAGQYLVRHLADSGDSVVAMARGELPASWPAGVSVIDADLRAQAEVEAAVREVRPEAIFHLGALTHVPSCESDRAEALRVNVLGTLHLIEAASAIVREARVLFVSSGQAYRPSPEPIEESAPLAPESFYGLTKKHAEEVASLLAARGARVLIARPFNHSGPGQRADFALPSFARQIAEAEAGLREPVVRVGNLSAIRDFLHVRDVVRAYRCLVAEGRDGGIYNVCSGVGRPIGAALEQLAARSRVAVRIDVDASRLRAQDTHAVVGASSRIQQETSWRPQIPFERLLDDLLHDARLSLRSG
ncbi:MAG: GDP-mannose 4,6-dehydratase [Planctomycetes bacterium]|nr:GDP-mannose 4,6-dehydratase [Planctomycetota bacterium]